MDKRFLFIILLPLVFSCETNTDIDNEKVMAYVPVYKSYEDISKIGFDLNKKLEKSGKIYVLEGALLINEPGAGIHIFDNSDETAPKRINFISIPGTQDVELKNKTLYADNGLDLVAIDISDIQNPKLIDRVKDVFPYPMFPPHENVKFECPDPTKGYVVDWVLSEVSSPKCSR
jgi:hypothetical protein